MDRPLAYRASRRIALLALVSVAGLLTPALEDPAGAVPVGSAFVTTSGTQLMLDGHPWFLYGASTYGTSNPGAPGTIPALISLADQAGLNTLRIVNMFDEGGSDAAAPFDAANWQRVDQLLAAMRGAGLRAILDLSAFRNHLHNRELLLRGQDAIADLYPIPSPQCDGKSGDDLSRCVGVYWCIDNPTLCTGPYSPARASEWDTFLGWVATRTNTVTGVQYRDDPTIAIVSFAGEPNPPNSGEPLKPTTTELTDFYERVFDQWKTYDPHHLVTSGGLLHIDWEEVYASGSGIDHEAIFALANQDVLSIHDYVPALPPNPVTDYKVQKVAAAAALVNKPWINEEFGFLQAPGGFTEADRAAWFQIIYDNGADPIIGVPAAGVAFWNLGAEVAGASHDVNPGTPATWAVVQQNAILAWRFVGFSSPVDAEPVLNVVKAGQTVPLRWRVLDAVGDPVSTIASVTVRAETLLCSDGSTGDLVEEVGSGSSGFQNLGDGYYQFNWKTPKTYAKSCKTVSIETDVGLAHEAFFRFTK